ncbi:hypothetical protein M378DRAFT_67776 [Amanita muscaria Koide BX008]|uniref:Uncharacterized protein n=1 Tax=Amanita muscaria (strain Koide BX008) TaxID=946122 RepID=A0A0C2TSX0_AMAMK|nr:hypothetical protein M378DRAFT_67776 [Amanita muscaria Koide BX008]
MADATHNPGVSVYSCRCLNVRIYPAPQQSAPPNPNEDPEFSQCYVGEDGIHVVHPHVTLRTRTRGLPIGGTSRCGRYTTLTCLICEVLAYRVYQIVPSDIEGKEGPLLPTEEWVENEVMKSSTGWIEPSDQCLVNEAVKALESSPDISTLFAIVLPKLQPSSPTLPVNLEAADSTANPPPLQPAASYLEKIKPLFSPAFTPSHPVFQHLASKASTESKILRSETEEYITRVVKEKRAEVERAEDELRDQVEAVWFKFKMTVDNIKKEKDKPKAPSRPFPPRGSHEVAIPDSPQGPRVAIREFVPVSTPPARISPSEGTRPSALSASLATSSFHHPKAVADAQAPAREQNGSNHSQSSSSTADSATLVRSPSREGASNVLQFRRTNDDTLNTAVSFKYFLDLEAEIERKKKERLDEANRKYQAQPEVGPSGVSEGPVVNGKKPEHKKPKEHETVRVKHVQVDTEGSIVEASEKSPAKGKRHVTFDVEPEVVTINSEANKSKADLNGDIGQDSRDMIFVLEDADGEVAEQSAGLEQTLPLLEQPAARPVARHRKTRSLASAGLPSSFMSLRPLSLPGPSHIRPMRSPHGVDSSSQTILSSLPRQSILDHQKLLFSHNHPLAEASEDGLDSRDAVILRLVAADTPSHRGAWKPDSQAWKSFTQSLGGKGRNSADVSEDEAGTGEDGLETTELGDSTEPSFDENGDYHQSRAGVPGSLPIPITQFTMKKQSLSLASYQPKTSLSERADPLGSKHPSATTLRRASYAERDRKRAMDPGALDFTAEEDEDESGVSEEETEIAEDDTGTRSRKTALKILQKSSEVPEEGMWRSLAT